LWAFLDFGDGVEEVGGDYFPMTMFPIHLRKGRDDGLTREAVTRTSPHPEEEVKGELYDTVTSSQAQCGFDSGTTELLSNGVEQRGQKSSSRASGVTPGIVVCFFQMVSVQFVACLIF
jgi:hypothetical protein